MRSEYRIQGKGSKHGVPCFGLLPEAEITGSHRLVFVSAASKKLTNLALGD